MHTKLRASTETDRRGLLAESTTANSNSTSTRTASIYTKTEDDRTPRTCSPAASFRSQATTITAVSHHVSVAGGELASYTESGHYKGFPSAEAYLQALREWVEEKKYIQPSSGSNTLQGWYGTRTMQDYLGDAEKPPVVGFRQKWKARKEEKLAKRRSSAAV